MTDQFNPWTEPTGAVPAQLNVPQPTNPTNPTNSADEAINALTQLGLTSPEQVLQTIQTLQRQLNEATAQRIQQNSIPTPQLSERTVPVRTPSISDHMEDIQPTQTVILPSIRMATPRHFSKQTLPGELSMWIDEIKAYIRAGAVRGAFMLEQEKIDTAASYLSGEARRKWLIARQVSELRPTGDPRKIDTLDKFFQYLLKDNSDWNEQEKIRQQYMKLRQRRSAGEFGRELILLANLLNPRPTEHEILERFKFGLQERVRCALVNVLDQPDNLEDFITLCDRIDQRLYEYRISQTSKHSFNMMAQSSGHKSNNTDKQQFKGSPEWNKWCHRENRCLECGKPGHKKSECRSKNRLNNKDSQNGQKDHNKDQSKDSDPKAVTFDVSKVQSKEKGKGSGRS